MTTMMMDQRLDPNKHFITALNTMLKMDREFIILFRATICGYDILGIAHIQSLFIENLIGQEDQDVLIELEALLNESEQMLGLTLSDNYLEVDYLHQVLVPNMHRILNLDNGQRQSLDAITKEANANINKAKKDLMGILLIFSKAIEDQMKRTNKIREKLNEINVAARLGKLLATTPSLDGYSVKYAETVVKCLKDLRALTKESRAFIHSDAFKQQAMIRRTEIKLIKDSVDTYQKNLVASLNKVFTMDGGQSTSQSDKAGAVKKR